MFLFITPHPPIIIEKIGKGEEKKAIKTIAGMIKIAGDIKKIKPKTIAIITPHGNVFSDALCINAEEKLCGDFKKFGHKDILFEFKNNIKKAADICMELTKNNINCLSLDTHSAKQYNSSADLDHGVLVPLYFIEKQYKDFDLIHISIGYLSKTELFKAGTIIADILGDENVLIISGDLSHKLSKNSPNGYDSMGKEYDEYIVKAIKDSSYINILDIDDNMVNLAGQCAQKPLELFIGALEGYKSESIVYSYEGPYGVGYMTAKITRGEKDSNSIISEYKTLKKTNFGNKIQDEDEYIMLARNTINAYIKHGIKIDVPDNLSEDLYKNRNGVFVSIKKEGRLRGCIGTISPTKKNIAQEIIENAISASTKDPRFNAIQESELNDLQISVDILFESENIESIDQLDVIKYGVIVSSGFKRGLLLPNLEGVNTAQEQVSIALNKAGINKSEKYNLQRFMVIRHK